MVNNNNAKNIVGLLAAGTLGFFILRALFRKKKVQPVKEAVETTEDVIKKAVGVVGDVVEGTEKTVKKVVKKAGRFVKGSQEAKDHMKKLSAMRGKGKKKKVSKKKKVNPSALEKLDQEGDKKLLSLKAKTKKVRKTSSNPRFKKGSPEAKAFMKKLRDSRGKKK